MQAPPSVVFFEVVRHTPLYVWGILAGLVVVGLVHLRSRETSRARVLALPIGLAGYSVAGAIASFGAPLLVVTAWALGMTLMLALSRWVVWPRNVRFVAARNRFLVPGSVAPLVAMVAVFAVRYVAAVVLILNPAWRGLAAVASAGGLAFGILSGLFAMRARAILASAQPASAGALVPAGAAPAAQ